MAHIDKHCEDCVLELGEEFRAVHEWLDEFAAKLGPAHRDIRHHAGGVEEALKKFGAKGAKAAEIHIKRDCHGIVSTKEQAKMWSLFGVNRNSGGATFLSDEQGIIK